jgi:hypothetical protein
MDQPPRTRCENCQTELAGEFCFECGQSAREYNVPISTFAKDMVSESFDLDSRLRATMRPLFFRPGLVPRDYVAGHRARFVPPFRLYLLASFAMFLLMSLGSGIDVRSDDGAQFNVGLTIGDPEAEAERAAAAEGGSATESGDATQDSVAGAPETTTQRLEQLEERLETRISEGVQRASENPGAFAEEFSNRMAQAMFLLLPVFALLLKLLYRKRLYVHHIVFAIYFHAWFFLVVAVTLMPGAIGFPAVSDVMAILLLWSPIYLFLAMRRFYEQSRILTFVKLFVLSNVYLLLASVTMLAVVLWTIAGT